MELTAGSLLRHSQLPPAARSLPTQCPSASPGPGASAWPRFPPPPTVLCSGEGPHAHPMLVTGGRVGIGLRSSRLPPAPTKQTEAWRGQGLARGHTKVRLRRTRSPSCFPIVASCPFSPGTLLPSLAHGLHRARRPVHSLMQERRRPSPESQSLPVPLPHHPHHSPISSWFGFTHSFEHHS